MSPTDIHAVAAGLEAWQQTVHDEVEAWRTTMSVDRALRHLRCVRAGATEAQRAQRAVRCAASRCGEALPESEVIRVARAAGDIARGMVAHDALPDDANALLEAWASLFPGAGVSAPG